MSLLYCLKQKQSNSFGPGLLKSTVCVKKEALFFLEKESLLSLNSHMLQGLGINGMEKRYVSYTSNLIAIRSPNWPTATVVFQWHAKKSPILQN